MIVDTLPIRLYPKERRLTKYPRFLLQVVCCSHTRHKPPDNRTRDDLFVSISNTKPRRGNTLRLSLLLHNMLP